MREKCDSSKRFIFCKEFFFYLAQQPNSSQGRLIIEVSRWRTITHRNWYDSFGRVIRPTQIPPLDRTQHSTLNTHNRQTSIPPVGNFFSCTLFVLHSYLCLCLDCLAFCLLSLHNKIVHAPVGIRTRNRSRLRPLGHWDRPVRIIAKLIIFSRYMKWGKESEDLAAVVMTFHGF